MQRRKAKQKKITGSRQAGSRVSNGDDSLTDLCLVNGNVHSWGQKITSTYHEHDFFKLLFFQIGMTVLHTSNKF